MKRWIACLLISFMVSTQLFAANFTDVKDNAWYKASVQYVVDNNIMSGENNSQFLPDKAINRAQVVSILYKLAGSPQVATLANYQDVASDAWYAIPASWANQMNIVGNTGTFSPANPVTHEELAAMLYNFAESLDYDFPKAQNPSGLLPYKDSWYVAAYAVKSVQWVCQVGLINGDSQLNFKPKEVVTRGEAADIFMRLHKAMAGEKLVITRPVITINHNALTDAQKKEQARVIAQHIADVILSIDGLTDLERVQNAAMIVYCYCNYCDYTMQGKDYATAYGVFIKGEFSCAGSTRALGMVLDCMGYQWQHVNENQYTHQWCVLTMDGKVGYADGMAGCAGYGTHFAF